VKRTSAVQSKSQTNFRQKRFTCSWYRVL